MKTRARLVVLLAVLGFCLPSYGEILVYKFTDMSSCYELEGGQWDVWKETNRGYIVLDISYANFTITQAEAISYFTDKQFERTPIDLELVRVEHRGKAEWVIMEKRVAVEGEEVTGEFTMLTGKAVRRNIGTADKREVPGKLSGLGLEDEIQDSGRYIDISKHTLTLYPAWTYQANVTHGGDFTATTQMIRDYLIGKGYTESSD